MIPGFVADALVAIGASVPAAVLSESHCVHGPCPLVRPAWRGEVAPPFAILIFAATIAIALILPVATLMVPAVDVRVPTRVGVSERATVTAAMLERAEAMDARGLSSAVAPVSPTPSASTIVWAIWGAGSAVFLLVPVTGLWEIRRLRRRGLPWPAGDDVCTARCIRVRHRTLHFRGPGRVGARSDDMRSSASGHRISA